MTHVKTLTVIIFGVILPVAGFAGSVSESSAAVLEFKPLPYAYDALEPHIDALTMEIHYDRHHRGYFTNLQKSVEGTDLSGKPVEDILAGISQYSEAVRNNAGGHYNHELFWSILSPDGGGKPAGALAEQIDKTFGSFDAFKDTFKKAALTRFGSGWAWLCVGDDGALFVASTANQDNPRMDIAEQPGIPILGLDVWEHAYYLKYQNKRASYIDAFWNVINWSEVSNRFEAAVK
jgi:superoxide dismutase, Fe-Mn family